MSVELDNSLVDALHELNRWLPSQPFRPKEHTFTGWFAGALVKQGYCAPNELLSELGVSRRHFVEGTGSELPFETLIGRDWCPPQRRKVSYFHNDRGGMELRYDLAALTAPPVAACGSFGSCDPPPRLIVETKALNSQTFKYPSKMLTYDLRKLRLAAEWWRVRRGVEITPLMLAVTSHAKGEGTTPERVRRWVERQPTRRKPALPDGVVVAVLDGKSEPLVVSRPLET